MKVALGRREFCVSHVCRQAWQQVLDVSSLRVPSCDAMNRKCVAQVVDAGADTASWRLYSTFAEQVSSGVLDGTGAIRATVSFLEEG